MVAEKANRVNMNRRLAEFQKKQLEEKNREREDDFMREMQEADMIRQAIDHDDKTFNTYAKRCLEEWEIQVGSCDQGKERDSNRARAKETADAEPRDSLRWPSNFHVLININMQKAEEKDIAKLVLDNNELNVQIKLPFDNSLLTEEDQPRSPYLTALSNSSGVFIYAMRQTLVIVGQDGLMPLCMAAKGVTDSGVVQRPTLADLEKQQQLLKVAFAKADVGEGPIERILLEEESEPSSSQLAVGFSSTVLIFDLAALLRGETSYKLKLDLAAGSTLATFCFVNGDCLALNDVGQVQVAGGRLKLGDLNTTPIKWSS